MFVLKEKRIRPVGGTHHLAFARLSCSPVSIPCCHSFNLAIGFNLQVKICQLLHYINCRTIVIHRKIYFSESLFKSLETEVYKGRISHCRIYLPKEKYNICGKDFFFIWNIGRISNQPHLFKLQGQLAVQTLSFYVIFPYRKWSHATIFITLYKTHSVHVKLRIVIE